MSWLETGSSSPLVNGVCCRSGRYFAPGRDVWYKHALILRLSAVKDHIPMSRVCQVTGKRVLVGNTVSHANNKRRRRFLPNLQYRRLWVESEKRFVTLRVSRQGLRTIDKKGIDAVLAGIRARGEKV